MSPCLFLGWRRSDDTMVMSAGLGGSAGQEQSTPGASLEGRFEREGNPPTWLSAVVLPCLGCHRQTETGHGKGEVPAAGPTGQEHSRQVSGHGSQERGGSSDWEQRGHLRSLPCVRSATDMTGHPRCPRSQEEQHRGTGPLGGVVSRVKASRVKAARSARVLSGWFNALLLPS